MTTILVSSNHLYNQLREFDFVNDVIESLWLYPDGEVRLKTSESDIFFYGHFSTMNGTYFDQLSCDYKSMINVLKTISDRPIVLYVSMDKLELKMGF